MDGPFTHKGKDAVVKKQTADAEPAFLDMQSGWSYIDHHSNTRNDLDHHMHELGVPGPS